MSERWRWIPGYEGLYMVSNQGRVMTIPHMSKDGLILRPRESNNHYMTVNLYDGSSYKKHLIHRLVAASFIPNPNNCPQVNHKDGNRQNNGVDNLEWVTARENIRHKYDTLGYSQKGRRSPLRRFTDEQVREIRSSKQKASFVAANYGVSRQCIADLREGRTYQDVD